MYDPTNAKLATLKPDVQLRAYWLVVSAREVGIPLIIISGLRSGAQNASVGGAVQSRHLLGRAFDVQVQGYRVADIPRSWWHALGVWAESNLGLRWGGRFSQYDPNHFDF